MFCSLYLLNEYILVRRKFYVRYVEENMFSSCYSLEPIRHHYYCQKRRLCVFRSAEGNVWVEAGQGTCIQPTRKEPSATWIPSSRAHHGPVDTWCIIHMFYTGGRWLWDMVRRNEQAWHLFDTLKKYYTISIDWSGTKFCGLTLKFPRKTCKPARCRSQHCTESCQQPTAYHACP